MRKLVLMSILVLLIASPSLAVPIIHFTEPITAINGWLYTGAANGTFTFNLEVDQGLGSGLDGLVGAVVVIPALDVSGAPGAPYTLNPQGTGEIKITNVAGTETYLKGTLGTGDLLAAGSIGLAYWNIKDDITGLSFPDAVPGGSDAIDAIMAAGQPLDFDVALTGGPSTFPKMLDGTIPEQAASYSDGATGSMTIVPEPATVALLGLGSLSLILRRRR
jgi:hypothetical protein